MLATGILSSCWNLCRFSIGVAINSSRPLISPSSSPFLRSDSLSVSRNREWTFVESGQSLPATMQIEYTGFSCVSCPARSCDFNDRPRQPEYRVEQTDERLSVLWNTKRALECEIVEWADSERFHGEFFWVIVRIRCFCSDKYCNTLIQAVQ